MINIKGINKAELLAALVNATQPLGLGYLQAGVERMTREEAQEWIDQGRWHDTAASPRPAFYFGYVRGRSINSDLSGDELDPREYDGDNGAGAAERVIAALREDGLRSMPAVRKALEEP